MNFNIYLNNNFYGELENYRKIYYKSRNSIITEALRDWLNTHKNKNWPELFFDFPADTKDLYPDIS